jgi:hypothetical protein
VIDAAKPVASAAVETITSLGPEDYVVAAGAAFLAYLLVPPVWSLVSSSLRGYKGTGGTTICIFFHQSCSCEPATYRGLALLTMRLL